MKAKSLHPSGDEPSPPLRRDGDSLSPVATLPFGWRWYRLGDLVERIDYGFTASADFAIKEPRFLRITDIQDSKVEWDKVPGCTIADDDIASNRLVDGDIVFARTGATTGKSFLVREPPIAVFASYLIRLRVKPAVEADFLWFFFQSDQYWKQIREKARGGIQPNFNATMLAALPVIVPPLPEQRRIATRLREQLAAVGEARAAVQAQSKAAQDLSAVLLRAVFTNAAAANWPKCKLGAVLRLRKEVVHPRDNPSGPAVFVGLEHVQSLTGERIGSLRVEMSQLTGRKPRFYTGDLVYGYLRPYLNKLWVAEFDGLCSVDQYVYEVIREKAETDFVAWFMRSPVYLERAPIDASPGQLPRIRTEEVASVEINLPPLKQQRALVAQIQDEFTETTALKQTLSARLTALHHLPGALLREAFAGRLPPCLRRQLSHKTNPNLRPQETDAISLA
jgi:type I restriction enzyme, S subunit